ncbi:hypothetical protein [Streptomyces sp. NPDC093149]|uniref:hypothetical protein n=1 Tax=Streptomyces sp. NPDC093149 TaxID=3366031 RepID=UPI003829FADF
MLDLVDNVMYDEMTLVEAEASAQIVQSAGLPVGSPFGPVMAAGLTHIEGLDIKDQQRLVQTAARCYAPRVRRRAAPGDFRPRRRFRAP